MAAGFTLTMSDRSPLAGSAWLAAAVLLAVGAALWLPALSTPFWGDDYVFLQGAHAANLAGEPWWSAFWPEIPVKFWRPLSQEGLWRIVEGALGADPFVAHLVAVAALAMAAAAVGVMGLALARVCAWSRAGMIGALSGLVYFCLALHLLPVHWVSATNSSLLVCFSALTLAGWIRLPDATQGWRWVLTLAIPLLLGGALLCKESAALVPLLMLVLLALPPVRRRPDRAGIGLWSVCCLIVGAWLVFRAGVSAPRDPQYALVIGANVVRNALSSVAWLFNIPRESLRMLASGQVLVALLWTSAILAPLLVAWALVARHAFRGFSHWQWAATGAFLLIALAPYLPLAWNSYAYYAAIAAMLPAILFARGLAGSELKVVAAALLGLSSLIAVQGTRWLDHPGLIGRARWAESVFVALQREPIPRPLVVLADDVQRFYAIGVAGLSWRLGIPESEISLQRDCPPAAGRCLRIARDGGWSWVTP